MSPSRFLCSSIALTAALWSPSVLAHISLDQGGTHLSRYGDSELKDGPCGRADGTRSTNVYTYKPGETISVTIAEFIPHPSYFRIAFDDDGDDDFTDPVSIKPIDPARPCPYNEFDQCGTTDDFQDFYNTPAVLEGMDNLDPHVTATLGQHYTWQVTLPDIECDNCTLQIIQVMQDTIHGAYNTDRSLEPTSYIEDNYHQCIDLVLDDGVANSPDAGNSGSAGAAGQPGDDSNDASSGDDGGCSVARGGSSAGTAGSVVSLALALGLLARRRPARHRR
jgi:hypothetical protein